MSIAIMLGSFVINKGCFLKSIPQGSFFGYFLCFRKQFCVFSFSRDNSLSASMRTQRKKLVLVIISVMLEAQRFWSTLRKWITALTF